MLYTIPTLDMMPRNVMKTLALRSLERSWTGFKITTDLDVCYA
jgi:hypothetical protein